MKKEKISIVVPIYNVEKYLKRCVDSIINQTYSNLEIILVNDGSTDSCPKICDEYKEKDNRIKVIHKKNGGQSDARNVGINIITGKYISFVDSDDYIEKDMYEILYENIKSSNADISICSNFIDYENGKITSPSNDKSIEEMTSKEALIRLNSFGKFDMAPWGKLYKTELFDNIRFPYGKICEDYYTMYKVFDIGNKMVYIDIPLYHYFQRINSTSRNKNIPLAFIEASYEQLQYFRKKHRDIIYVAETAYAFANIATYNAYIKRDIKCDKKLKKLFKKAVRENIKSIIFNKNISKLKKIQALIFYINMNLYAVIFKNIGKSL